MFVLVGNSQSSGSSFLADLLDSTPYSCCGEELGVFSGKRLYDFSRFKANILQRSIASSVYALSNGLITKDLHSYGFNIETFAALCRESEDILDFTERFADYVTALRGKPGNALVFEKTPQNISCIGEFLDAFKDSYFVYVVRNPLFVYASLLRRNFPPYIALSTWLIDVARYARYKDHERVIPIRYEDLVEDPYAVVRLLLMKLASVDLSERRYRERLQRKQVQNARRSEDRQLDHDRIRQSEKREYRCSRGSHPNVFSTVQLEGGEQLCAALSTDADDIRRGHRALRIRRRTRKGAGPRAHLTNEKVQGLEEAGW